jgi:hypothetical protein
LAAGVNVGNIVPGVFVSVLAKAEAIWCGWNFDRMLNCFSVVHLDIETLESRYLVENMEREKGFKPAMSNLGKYCSIANKEHMRLRR